MRYDAFMKIIRIIQSVLAAFFGVQNNKKLHRIIKSSLVAFGDRICTECHICTVFAPYFTMLVSRLHICTEFAPNSENTNFLNVD